MPTLPKLDHIQLFYDIVLAYIAYFWWTQPHSVETYEKIIKINRFIAFMIIPQTDACENVTLW